MLTLRSLHIFLAVAEKGNFAAAGASIGLTAAAVGVQMKGLEATLNRCLFERSARAITLTSEGRRLVPQARNLLANAESLLNTEDELVGKVCVGAVVSALMGAFGDALRSIKRSYPLIDIKLLSGLSSDFAGKVDSGELDAALVTQPPYVLPNRLMWTPLYAEPLVLIVPSRPYFELAQDPLAILRDSPFLRFDRQTWTGYLVDDVLRQCGVSIREEMEFNSAEAITEVVRQGFGVAIVPQLANVRWQDDQQLKVYHLPNIQVVRRIGLLERTLHFRQRFTAKIKSYFDELPPQ